MVVESGDRGIGPVSLRFRGETEHDEPRDEATERDHERDGPGPVEAGHDGGTALPGGRRRDVAAQHPEEQVGRHVQGGVEGDRAEAANDPDQGTQDNPFPQVACGPDPTLHPPHSGVEARAELLHHAYASNASARASSDERVWPPWRSSRRLAISRRAAPR